MENVESVTRERRSKKTVLGPAATGGIDLARIERQYGINLERQS